jgi:hypothetical protein
LKLFAFRRTVALIATHFNNSYPFVRSLICRLRE